MKKAIYVRIDGDGFPYSDEGDRGSVEKQPHFIIAEADMPTDAALFKLLEEYGETEAANSPVGFVRKVLAQLGLCREGE